MKRSILLTFVLCSLLVFTASAANRYWVGGSGSWDDSKHWSEISGGKGGATVPSEADDVYFDSRSFKISGQTVILHGNGYCHSLSWSSITPAIFEGSSKSELYISGSFIIFPSVDLSYEGKVFFTGTGLVTTAGKTFMGDVSFRGGEYTLTGALITKGDVHLEKGTLNTAGNDLECNSFIESGVEQRGLKLGSSKVTVHEKWDTRATENFAFEPAASQVILINPSPSNFLPGRGALYSNLRTGPVVTPLNHTVTTTVVPNPCNGDCIATATANVTGGSGSYSYLWSGPNGYSSTSQTATGLCAGTYLVVVTDLVSGDQVPAFATVVDPPPLVIFFSNTPASCNGSCNGSSSAVVAGGTPPYTYSWAPGGQTTAGITNQCAGTYTLTITDANGCTRTQMSVITQPTAIVSNGSFTDVTCFNACDGTATVNPSGGTPPYTISWSPGGQTTNTITNLCPGTYTATITDANSCTRTYVATITQPPVLSATVVKTNASCGGVCDGTATSTVTGGTPNYSYSWAPGGQTTSAVTGLCAGSYTLTVTDANGCQVTRTVIITEPLPLLVSPTGVNISCFNTCNGTAAANATGGTAPYSYLWSPGGQTTATINNLCPGTYTVDVTDFNGCTTSGNVTITQPTLLVANGAGTDVTCFSLCNGSATANPAGGTAPYSYSWAPGNITSQTISNLCPGSYTVTVTDANGCTDNQVIVITQPLPLAPSATKTNASCNGSCDGTATANPTGGTSPYSYSWSPGGQTTATITGLCAGNYVVTVTDANGCTANQTVTITQPNPLTVNASGTPIACNAACTSSISANIAGGTAPYSYSWSPGGQTTSTITGQCAGSYTVLVTDANGCTNSASVTINQPTSLTVITQSTNATCNGSCNGTAAGIAGGGTPPYAFLWSPGGQTTTSVSNLCAGSYTLSVTDANGCQGTSVITITEPTLLQANVTGTNVTCAAACNGTATAAPAGGTAPYTYQWAPGGQTTSTITNLCAGTYTVTVRDVNNCTSVQTIQITQPTPLNPTITATTSSCNICNGSASSNVTGGVSPYTYSWSTSPTVQTTQTATGLCPGNYTLTVTDANGCNATTVATVVQTVNITITSSSSSLSCFGACDGIATANANGGQAPYQFLWSTNPIQTTSTATGLCAGTYSVTATDANGCFNTNTVTFTNPPLLTATMSSTNTSCNATCDGTATATPSGGTGAYSYLWSNGQTTQTATGLCAGSYTVTVSDVNNCPYIDSVTISQSPSIAANPTVTDANCNLSDGSITLAPSGGVAPYTFLWSNAATTQNLTNIPAGTYNVTITDVAGCSSTFTITVNNLNGPTLTDNSTNVSCFGACDGTASVTVSGGTGPFSYLWSPGGQTTPSVTGLCQGTWTAQVTDALGCMTITTINITEPAQLASNATITNASCGGVCNGSIVLNVTGGTGPYTYSWAPGGQTTSSVSGLCAGNYSVTITDANGCNNTLTFTITEPPLLSVAVSSTNVTCFNACNGTATATPAGGTSGYTYSWSNSAVLANVVNLCPGSYSVTVTDANGCTATGSVAITEPPQLTSTITSGNASCNASCTGTSTITPSGGTPGYTYLWSPGGATTQTANGLCAGSYNVTVSDANNCTTSQSVAITEPPVLVPNATQTNATCNGACNGSATSNPSGGTAPYSYSWAPGGQTTQSITGLCPGSYTVTVTDANGCTAFQVVTVTQPNVLLANTTTTSPLCVGDCNGTASASPLGGTTPYSYIWSPGGQTTPSINGLCAGTYSVDVIDANGCATLQNVTVNNPSAIDVTSSVAPANCGTNNGTITVTPITGVAPYTYTWNPPVSTTNSATGLGAGIYTVTVTDANGCDSTFAVALSNTGGPSGATNATVNTSCAGTCDGASSVAPIGGTAPYAFAWFDAGGNPLGVTNDTATALCQGIYIIQITDANGCMFFANDTVNQPPAIAANAVVTQTTCSGICNGAVSTAPTGGTGPYTFLWMPGGQTTSSITNLCGGTYTVTITDANGCSVVDSFLVTPSIVLAANVTSTNINCSSACNGTATVSVLTGSAPYSYLWDDPFGQVTTTATNLCSGIYNVTVSDALGCSITMPVTISATNAIAANPSVTNASCGMCDGQATITPTGGTAPFTYVWNTGETTNMVDSLCAGVYFVSITDSNGCSASFQVPVINTGSPAIIATITNATCPSATDGSASVSVTGGVAPYTYLWIPGGQTTSSVTGLAAGTYFVQVQDANGCSSIDTVVIGSPAPILDNRTVINATCGSSNGSITLNPSGGTGPYTYSWSPAVSAGNSATNLAAGIYNVTITDANGCSQTIPIPISNPGGPGIAATSMNITCNGSCNGMAMVDTTGGSTGPFAYAWSNGQTNDTITNLCPGTYVVQVTDGAGCVSSAQVIITQPLPLAFSMPAVIDETCSGSCNGSANMIVSGGTLPYTFSWSNGSTSPSSTGLCSGSYTVTVTDANGCSGTNTATITGPVALTISSVVTDASCNTVNDGAIDITVTGGVTPYSYQWSGGSGATTEDLTGVLTGTYFVLVTDSNGCQAADTIIVNSTISVIANAGNDTTFCEGGTFVLNGSNSQNATGFQWLQLPGNTPVGNTATVTVAPSFGSTSYVLVATNGACFDSDTITITSNPPPVADAGADVTILIFNSATIGGNPTGAAGSVFSWSPSAGLNDSTAANPVASPTVTTTYTVTVTNSNGCTEIDTITVTVLPQIVFPNGISPNGDGSNDEWIIDNIEQFPNCVVEIYNRWGELLFRSVGYHDRWDGTYKGQPLPVGTYYYIINLNDPLYPDAFTGPITILR